MTRADIRVFEDSAKGGREIPRDSIRWQTVRPRTFPYRLVQEPGPENPLGGVKLVLATRFAVYLHDTPNRAVFGKEYRLLSHGCIRVEGIERLVARLLPEWGADSIGEAMKTGRDRLVELADPVPVHLVYWTAWGGAAGPVEFRPDAYGWDALLLGAISGRSRVPARTRSSPPGGTPARGAPTHRGR
jgi:murein L,D-transpeptidase YcbB/YkuD